MFSDWLTFPAFIVLHLGYASVLGDQLYQLRWQGSRRQWAVALVILGLVFLPPLGLPAGLQWAAWLAAALLVVLFALYPHLLPPYLRCRQFLWHYCALAMGLVTIWGLLHSEFLFSALAFCTGVLAWNRIRNFIPWLIPP